MKKITNDILWDFADGLLPNTQQKEIAQALLDNPTLQEQLDVIIQQKVLFSTTELEQPKLDFATTLLEKWAAEQPLQTATIAAPTTQVPLLKGLFASFILLSITLLYLTFSSNTVSEPLPIVVPNIEIPWSKMSFILVSILAMLSIRLLEKMYLPVYGIKA